MFSHYYVIDLYDNTAAQITLLKMRFSGSPWPLSTKIYTVHPWAQEDIIAKFEEFSKVLIKNSQEWDKRI